MLNDILSNIEKDDNVLPQSKANSQLAGWPTLGF